MPASIGNGRIGAIAWQDRNAGDLDHVGAGSLDVRSHGIQEVRHVDDVRLTRGVLDHGDALGLDGGDHEVDRGSDAHHVEEDVFAAELLGLDENLAILDRHLAAHRFEALDVLVDRPRAEVASAGHEERRLVEAPEKRPHQIVGSPDAACLLVCGFTGRDRPRVDVDRTVLVHADLRTERLADLKQDVHIGDVRQILDPACPIEQHGRRDDAQRGVL